MLLTCFSGMWKVPTAKILAEDSWVLGTSCRPWAGTAQPPQTIYLFFLFQQALTQGQTLVHFWPCTQPSSSSVFLQRSPLREGQHCPSLGTMVILGFSFLLSSSRPSAYEEKAGQRRPVQSGPVENPPASPPAPPTRNLNLSFPSTVYGIKWGSWGASLCYCLLNVGDSPQFIFPETTRALCWVRVGPESPPHRTTAHL